MYKNDKMENLNLSDDIINIIKTYLNVYKYVDIDPDSIVTLESFETSEHSCNNYEGCPLCGHGPCSPYGYIADLYIDCWCEYYNKHRHFQANTGVDDEEWETLEEEHNIKVGNINRIEKLMKNTNKILQKTDEMFDIRDTYKDGGQSDSYIENSKYGYKYDGNINIIYCSMCELLYFSIDPGIDHQFSANVVYIIVSFTFKDHNKTYQGTPIIPKDQLENWLSKIDSGLVSFTYRKLTNVKLCHRPQSNQECLKYQEYVTFPKLKNDTEIKKIYY